MAANRNYGRRKIDLNYEAKKSYKLRDHGYVDKCASCAHWQQKPENPFWGDCQVCRIYYQVHPSTGRRQLTTRERWASHAKCKLYERKIESGYIQLFDAETGELWKSFNGFTKECIEYIEKRFAVRTEILMRITAVDKDGNPINLERMVEDRTKGEKADGEDSGTD